MQAIPRVPLTSRCRPILLISILRDALRTQPCGVASAAGRAIQSATDLGQPLGVERGDDVADVALRE